MARGDHIRVRRKGYWHHGIDCGDGTVIHYTGEPWNMRDAAVRRTTLAEFEKGVPHEIVSHQYRDGIDAVLGRAASRIGETSYHSLKNNCEHFARWCMTGDGKSYQVRRVVAAAAGAVLVAGAAAVVLSVPLLRGTARRILARRQATPL